MLQLTKVHYWKEIEQQIWDPLTPANNALIVATEVDDGHEEFQMNLILEVSPSKLQLLDTNELPKSVN